jgi:hypothetical protein
LPSLVALAHHVGRFGFADRNELCSAEKIHSEWFQGSGDFTSWIASRYARGWL